VYQKHPNWATNKYTAEGRLNTQLWDEERLTTWFDTFMPTLELRNDTVAELMSDSALVWITEYDFDGFRHDATKHIPMNFTRLLTAKIRAASDNHVYQIGETYGSDELIASYVGSGKVDAQFNFNLYDAAFEAFTQEGATFDRLLKALESSLTYYGHHHLMGNISGNQDKPRFSSMASGHLSMSEDSKLAGWTREIPEPTERGYRKMAAIHAFNIAVPGIPILYYGDEIALHGGNDPDNRRMMPFDFSDRQQQLFDRIARLNENRTNIMALNYGSTTVHQPEPHLLIIVRKYMEQEVRFFFNNSNEDRYLEEWDITVPADGEIYQTRNCGQFNQD
jgi:glycosidase